MEALTAGVIHVECPQCGEAMPATVTCRILNNDRAHEGEATLRCEPDMTDVWAHVWSHSA